MSRRIYTSTEVRKTILEFCKEVGVSVIDIKPLHSTLDVLDPDTGHNFAYGIDIQMPCSKLILLSELSIRKITGHIVKVRVKENFNVFFIRGEEDMTTWTLSQPLKHHCRHM